MTWPTPQTSAHQHGVGTSSAAMAGLLAAGMSALSLSAAQGSFTGSKLRCNTAAAPAARRPVTLIEAVSV